MGELRVWRWVFAALIACGFWNVCAEAASASLSFPRTILQIGEPRTATSLQFSTLCAAAAAKFKRHPEVRVECGFNLWTQIPNQDPNKVVVMKAHSFDDAHRRARLRMFRNLDPSDFLVFMTARNHTESALAQELRDEYNLPVAYTAVTSDVAVEGYRVGHEEYQRLLGLSESESEEVLEWLQLWSDIRVCCGAQMSDAWRHVLAPDASVPCTSFAGSASGSSKTQSARAINSAEKCQALNISSVEHAIMQTELYKSMRERVPMLARASSRDGPLTGTYCEICSQNIAKYSLGHNDRCVGVKNFAKMKRWSIPCNRE